MVLAVPQPDVLIGKTVVDFGVDGVHQRCYAGEFGDNGIKQCGYRLTVVLAKGHHCHDLSRRGDAYHQSAQQAALGLEIVERIAVRFAEILDKQTQSIAEIVLEMTRLYVEHLVERAGNMKACRVAVRKLLSARKLLECQPAAVGKGVFHLVAVVPDLGRTYNG